MSRNICKWDLNTEQKEVLITRLTDELVFLRTKLGLSQEELSSMIGLSRQTYSTLETKRRLMSWSTYLSLLFVFDNYEQTHYLIRSSDIFPHELFATVQVGSSESSLFDILNYKNNSIIEKLDDQAIHTIETVVMLEYARCNKMSGESVIKAFDGRKFVNVTEKDLEISKAIQSIKDSVVDN